jgi:ATP-dependent RNA helicase RhlE
MYMVNYDISNEPETYVHRIWRTWRAWKNWIAYSFCNQEEVEYLLDVQKMLWRKIDVITDHPFAIEVDESIKAPKKQQRAWRWRWSHNWRQWNIPKWWGNFEANRKRKVRRQKNKRG